jgi:hypothetical protein
MSESQQWRTWQLNLESVHFVGFRCCRHVTFCCSLWRRSNHVCATLRYSLPWNLKACHLHHITWVSSSRWGPVLPPAQYPECTDQLCGNRFPCITWTQLLSWNLNLIHKLSVLWNISLEVIIWKKVDLFAYSCHLVFWTIGSQSVIYLPLGAPQGWSEHL